MCALLIPWVIKFRRRVGTINANLDFFPLGIFSVMIRYIDSPVRYLTSHGCRLLQTIGTSRSHF